MLILKSGHIQLPSALVQELFGNEDHINFVYYSERFELLIAAQSKSFFSKLHKTHWQHLKFRNNNGDKTLFILDTLIDFDLNTNDRELVYSINKNGILTIKLN